MHRMKVQTKRDHNGARSVKTTARLRYQQSVKQGDMAILKPIMNVNSLNINLWLALPSRWDWNPRSPRSWPRSWQWRCSCGSRRRVCRASPSSRACPRSSGAWGRASSVCAPSGPCSPLLLLLVFFGDGGGVEIVSTSHTLLRRLAGSNGGWRGCRRAWWLHSAGEKREVRWSFRSVKNLMEKWLFISERPFARYHERMANK